MSPQELYEILHRQPFLPFRIHLADGRSFDVPHPEFVLVTARTAVVGVYPTTHRNGRAYPDYAETIALSHIMSMEPLEQKS